MRNMRNSSVTALTASRDRKAVIYDGMDNIHCGGRRADTAADAFRGGKVLIR